MTAVHSNNYRVTDLQQVMLETVQEQKLDADNDGVLEKSDFAMPEDAVEQGVQNSNAQKLHQASMDPLAVPRTEQTAQRLATEERAEVLTLASDDLKGATLEERQRLIAEIADVGVFTWVDDTAEEQVLTILETTPAHQRRQLVEILDQAGLNETMLQRTQGAQESQMRAFLEFNAPLEQHVAAWQEQYNDIGDTLSAGMVRHLIQDGHRAMVARREQGEIDRTAPEYQMLTDIHTRLENNDFEHSYTDYTSRILLNSFLTSTEPSSVVEIESKVNELYSYFGRNVDVKIPPNVTDVLIDRVEELRSERIRLGADDVPVAERPEELLLANFLEFVDGPKHPPINLMNHGTAVAKLRDAVDPSLQ